MSNITFDEFSQRFVNEININLDKTKDVNLNDIPEYDSMGKINISLLIEELFDFQIGMMISILLRHLKTFTTCV